MVQIIWNDCRKKIYNLNNDLFERNAILNFSLIEWIDCKHYMS